jgi:hypothetical protein
MEYGNASAISFANELPLHHGSSMFNSVAIATTIAVVLAMGLVVASKMGELDEREPPLLKPGIPLIGHLFGILRWQVGYMQILRWVRDAAFADEFKSNFN